MENWIPRSEKFKRKKVGKHWIMFLSFLLVATPFFPIIAQENDVLAENGGREGIQSSNVSPVFILERDAVPVDPALTIDISTTTSLDQASIVINDFMVGDTLNFNNQNGISGTYNDNNGVLTLTGNATLADYEDALRSVTFSTISTGSMVRDITVTIGAALYFDPTQHFYEFVPARGISWTEAKVKAGERYLYGRQGYLATITSDEENNFVKEKAEGQGWLGASDWYETINSALGENRYANQGEAEGNWYWVTGPEAGMKFWEGEADGSPVNGMYNNWHHEEPNDYGEGEYYAHIFGPAGAPWSTPSTASQYYGYWNDYANEEDVDGYMVEYGGLSTDNIAPVDISMGKTLKVFLLIHPLTENIIVNATDNSVTVTGVPDNTVVKIYFGEDLIRTSELVSGSVQLDDIPLNEGDTVHVSFTEEVKGVESDRAEQIAVVRSDAIVMENATLDSLENGNVLLVEEVPVGAKISVYDEDGNLLVEEINNSGSTSTLQLDVGLHDVVKVSITESNRLESDRITVFSESLKKEMEDAIDEANGALDRANQTKLDYRESGGHTDDAVYRDVEEAIQVVEDILAAEPVNREALEEATASLNDSVEALKEVQDILALENAILEAENTIADGEKAMENHLFVGGEDSELEFINVDTRISILQDLLNAEPKDREAIENATEDLQQAVEELEKATAAKDLDNLVKAAVDAKKRAEEEQGNYETAGGKTEDSVYENVASAIRELDDALNAEPKDRDELELATESLQLAVDELERARKDLEYANAMKELANSITSAEKVLELAGNAMRRYISAGGTISDDVYTSVEQAVVQLKALLGEDPQNREAIEEAIRELVTRILALDTLTEEMIQAAKSEETEEGDVEISLPEEQVEEESALSEEGAGTETTMENLPKTATTMYSILLAGLILLSIGLLLLFGGQRRKPRFYC
ncbi:LPXTG cell wall anchor domain-containing protein [Evansella tamaricis]|uniref:LPXTG cell wall anchor domain-containing protein n=1 Tax=Evansella tamaricis TaxID=2069301 RepID=A0ABS6JB42_9BACI|nr:LPXTG cell wall anchor domain-containing protein [Evansella tamaricis]MBU9710655.1 LPXTG cell wall anchor domain-containing protein [Evansella tamaricis]